MPEKKDIPRKTFRSNQAYIDKSKIWGHLGSSVLDGLNERHLSSIKDRKPWTIVSLSFNDRTPYKLFTVV